MSLHSRIVAVDGVVTKSYEELVAQRQARIDAGETMFAVRFGIEKPPPVAVGLQCDQDMIGVSGRFIATMWIFVPIPGAAAFSLFSEAMNRSPIFVKEDDFVSKSAVARWQPKYLDWWRSGGLVANDPDKPYPERDNDCALVVMNNSHHGRLLIFIFEVVQATSVVMLTVVPNQITATLYLLIMLLYEFRSYVWGGSYTKLYDRRCEWRRRADEFEQRMADREVRH